MGAVNKDTKSRVIEAGIWIGVWMEGNIPEGRWEVSPWETLMNSLRCRGGMSHDEAAPRPPPHQWTGIFKSLKQFIPQTPVTFMWLMPMDVLFYLMCQQSLGLYFLPSASLTPQCLEILPGPVAVLRFTCPSHVSSELQVSPRRASTGKQKSLFLTLKLKSCSFRASPVVSLGMLFFKASNVIIPLAVKMRNSGVIPLSPTSPDPGHPDSSRRWRSIL